MTTSSTSFNFLRIFMASMLVAVSLLVLPQLIHAQNNSTIVTSINNSIEVTNVTKDSAIISWRTSEPTTSLVWYRLSNNSNAITYQVALSAAAQRSTGYRTEHRIKVNNLQPNTQYTFTVGGVNRDGATSISNERTFTTSANNNSNGLPVINTFTVTGVTTSKASVNVIANEPVTITATYNVRGSTSTQMVQSSPAATSHVIPLVDLNAQTDYQVKIVATDRSGNSVTSDTIGWTTVNNPNDTMSPVISNVQLTNISNSSATITWTTNEPTTSVVWYRENNTNSRMFGLLNDTKTATESREFTTSHKVTISGLTEGRGYLYRVGGTDQANNVGQSDERSFTAGASVNPTPTPNTSRPIIYNLSAAPSYTSRAATIRWSTNEATTDVITYSTSPDFTDSTTKTVSQGRLTRSHAVSLRSLNRNTFYYFKVTSTDQDKNATTYATGVFYLVR
ncbi:MAG TPA: fibronectin type III domain-containing protein [Candidatus Paceibacterota bacterium]